MKTTHRILALAVTLVVAATFTTSAPAADSKVVAGPKGGRLLPAEPNPVEFFVTPDRKVDLTFYDAAGKQAVAPDTQQVTVTAEAPGGKTTLTLAKTETGFVSQEPLPAGEPYRVVVQVRPSAGAKPQNFRVDLNLTTCGECQLVEYACICEGH